jgi:hypothetical protein
MAQDREAQAISNLEELTEAVSAGLLRAVASRRAAGGKLDHRITAGAWIEPPPIGGGNQPPVIRRRSDSLSRGDLSRLSTGARLSQSGIGKLNDAIAADTELGRRLLGSISTDILGTMDALFELSDTERAQLSASQSEDAEMLRELPGLFGDDADVPLDGIVLSVEPAPRSAKSRKIDYEVKVECKGGKSDGKGNWSCGGSFTIKF